MERMDVSVVAAVGSFVVSERVLKPKATALFILGCLLAYDLTTKTHDLSSLRVYRGMVVIHFLFACQRFFFVAVAFFLLLLLTLYKYSASFITRTGNVGVYIDDVCLVVTDLETKWRGL